MKKKREARGMLRTLFDGICYPRFMVADPGGDSAAMEEVKTKMKNLAENYDQRIRGLEQSHLESKVIMEAKLKNTQEKRAGRTHQGR